MSSKEKTLFVIVAIALIMLIVVLAFVGTP